MTRRTGVAGRVYSNMPDAYPVSGTKPANETDWSRQVIGEKRTFVANDIDAIAAVFDDHELIKSLGCESVINVPIIVAAPCSARSTACTRPASTRPNGSRPPSAEAAGAVCLLLNERVNGGQ
jgi:hypothetical protein